MNDKEIEKIINRNNLIEQNIINQESKFSEKNIITQTKKISPFIEIIDSSRFDDNVLNINENFNNINNIEDKETIENKGSINSNQKENINNNEEPMTFNPNRKINFSNDLSNKDIKSEAKNFLTFKNEEDDKILEKNNNKEEQSYEFKFNEDKVNIDELITIIKKLIDKMKYKFEKNKEYNINSKFVDKIKQIKDDVINLFDNAIKEETFKIKNFLINDNNKCGKLNTNNFFESQLAIKNKSNNFSYCKNSKIDEVEYLYKTQIINLRKKIILFEKENNDLKQIIENSRNIIEELLDKNKLLSSKLIKYKSLYENRNNIQ